MSGSDSDFPEMRARVRAGFEESAAVKRAALDLCEGGVVHAAQLLIHLRAEDFVAKARHPERQHQQEQHDDEH